MKVLIIAKENRLSMSCFIIKYVKAYSKEGKGVTCFRIVNWYLCWGILKREDIDLFVKWTLAKNLPILSTGCFCYFLICVLPIRKKKIAEAWK